MLICVVKTNMINDLNFVCLSIVCMFESSNLVSCCSLGFLWLAFGAPLAPPWSTWTYLEHLWTLLGLALAFFWVPLAPLWSTLTYLGCLWGPFGVSLGSIWVLFGPPGVPWHQEGSLLG